MQYEENLEGHAKSESREVVYIIDGDDAVATWPSGLEDCLSS